MMKRFILATTALTASAFAANAGGLDRSGQDIGIIFESGNRFELSFGHATPSVDGVDLATSGPTGEVAGEFNIISGGLRYELNDQLSFALVVDEPYGSDILYPTLPTSPLLGGTQATVDSVALTALARYKFNDSFSVHGGLRYQEIDATVVLNGAAYGPLSGYRADFGSDGAVGFVVGAAFEKPEIALRVALTYSSKIEHDLPTTETVRGVPVAVPGITRVETPESLNLEAQTGIAEGTLLFGSIRYARYSDTIVSPAFFDGTVDPATPGTSLTDIEDSTDFEIGIGRRFNDKWSGSLAFGYQSKGDSNLVSPLAPTDGSKYISVGAKYQASDRLDISAGIRYTKLGDAFAETGTPDTARANFSDNSAVSIGVKIGYNF